MIGLASGWVAARRLCPERLPALRLWLGSALALGCVSLIHYAWLLAGKPGLVWLFALECAALGAAFAVPLRAAPVPTRPLGDEAPRALRVLLLLAIAAGLLVALHVFRSFPHGAWDAVDLWNVRAVGLLRADLAQTLATAHHKDYPLLLPLAIAHLESWVGERELVPMAVASVFGAATAGLLHAATARWSGRRVATVVTIVLLATPLWAFHATSQRADVPLACFMLGSVVALTLHELVPDPRLLVLAGVQLGCALWTKNEGILFAVVAGTAWLATSGRAHLREAWRIAAGAAPFTLALLHHKLTCGATTDLIAGQGAATWDRLLDAGRYVQATSAFLREGAFYAVVTLALAVWLARARRGKPAVRVPFAWLTIVLMLAGYFAVYVTTPHDLAWHLESSLGRVLLQAWPIALLAVGTRASSPSQRGRNTTGIDSQPWTNSVRMRRSSRSFTA